MRWLADENFPGTAIRDLRNLGRHVVAAREQHGSVADREIFEIARREGFVLLTFDKGFGDLYRESPLIAPRRSFTHGATRNDPFGAMRLREDGEIFPMRAWLRW